MKFIIMKKNIFYILLLLALTFFKVNGQEKIAVLGSSYFNTKTYGIYQEQVEKMGGKVIQTFLDTQNPLMFVLYDESKINANQLAERLSKNEFQQPVYVKEIQNTKQLQELGIQDTKILSYFNFNSSSNVSKELEENQKIEQKLKEQAKNEMPKEFTKEGKHYVKCDWAPFYYEVTGNPEIDNLNYAKAKEKWINENPKEYQNLSNNTK